MRLSKSMSEQVVVGRLVDESTIKTEDDKTVSIADWQGRAVWSYLRLQLGKVNADEKIKGLLGELGGHMRDKDTMSKVLCRLMPDGEDSPYAVQRDVQFILEAGEVVAVASTKHLRVSPSVVYETARDILKKDLDFDPKLEGGSVFFKKVAGLRLGVQISGGSITTRMAIRVSAMVRVEMCFNPLSWLGTGNLQRFGISGEYDRVLRIEKITELRPRLESAIQNGQHGLGDLQAHLDHTKTISISAARAKILATAFASSYGLGRETIHAVLEQFTGNDKTQWGLGMAMSYVAEHGEFKREVVQAHEHRRQALSTASAGILLVKDLGYTVGKSAEWLRGHPELTKQED